MCFLDADICISINAKTCCPVSSIFLSAYNTNSNIFLCHVMTYQPVTGSMCRCGARRFISCLLGLDCLKRSCGVSYAFQLVPACDEIMSHYIPPRRQHETETCDRVCVCSCMLFMCEVSCCSLSATACYIRKHFPVREEKKGNAWDVGGFLQHVGRDQVGGMM